MKKMNENTSLHPSWVHYRGMLTPPLILMGFVYFADDSFNAYLALLALETLLVVLCFIDRMNTTYLIMADRVEIKTGILVKTSQTVMYHQIIGTVCTETIIQSLFGVGNIYIVTAAGMSRENNLMDIPKHQEIADFFTSNEGGPS